MTDWHTVVFWVNSGALGGSSQFRHRHYVGWGGEIYDTVRYNQYLIYPLTQVRKIHVTYHFTVCFFSTATKDDAITQLIQISLISAIGYIEVYYLAFVYIFKNIPKRFLVCLLWIQSKAVIYFIFRHFWPFQCNNPLQLSINLQIFVYFSSISLFSLVQTLFTSKCYLEHKFCYSWCLFFGKNMSFSRFSFLTIFLTSPK